MALKDSRIFSWKRLAPSFKYAFQGMIYAAKNEKNFLIHITAAVLVIGLSVCLKINHIEWLFIVVSIFGVLALELFNSALERAVDLSTDEIKPLAKHAKDLAAAAVLVYVMMTVIIGIIIFGPKLLRLVGML